MASYFDSQIERIRKELGETQFRLLLALIESQVPTYRIAAALSLPAWRVVIVRKVVAQQQYAIVQELKHLVPPSPLRLIYSSRRILEENTCAPVRRRSSS
jgi:hypothetical protein